MLHDGTGSIEKVQSIGKKWFNRSGKTSQIMARMHQFGPFFYKVVTH